MTRLTVVGGVYRERCSWPEWDQVFGSGGRAAAALGGVVPDLELVTYAEPELARHFAGYAEMYGFNLRVVEAPQRVTFEYVHPMSLPVIRPSPGLITRLPPIDVTGEAVLRFGMMESTGRVRAEVCVYDPQSAFSPELFSANGSATGRLAVVANRGEIAGMTGVREPVEGARALLVSERAEVVVVKAGTDGAIVVTAEAVIPVHAYRSERTFTIGSGDVFAAAFAAAWGVRGLDPVASARITSVAVSEYVDSRALPIRDMRELAAADPRPLVARPGEVYLAGPFFTMAQRWQIDEARRCLAEVGMRVFSPFHDIGPGLAGDVAPADIAAIERCDALFAVLDGLDPGTLYEVGYARALGKPVYGFAQVVKDEDLKMVVGSGCLVYDDFVTAVHQLAWRP